jgi:hypothetical protein
MLVYQRADGVGEHPCRKKMFPCQVVDGFGETVPTIQILKVLQANRTTRFHGHPASNAKTKDNGTDEHNYDTE